MIEASAVSGYHAHVYFDASSVEQARALCEAARDKFGVQMGRVHEKNVGPHPRWSCQLAFEPAIFGKIIPWLALNRDGLTVFIHPETGDGLKDHRDHDIWVGESLTVDLSIFDVE